MRQLLLELRKIVGNQLLFWSLQVLPRGPAQLRLAQHAINYWKDLT